MTSHLHAAHLAHQWTEALIHTSSRTRTYANAALARGDLDEYARLCREASRQALEIHAHQAALRLATS